jgi:hypothetical protein
LQEREEARKKKAEKLMRGEGVSVSEREIARRVLSTVFGDEDGVHGEKEEEGKEREEELLDHVARVRRQPSFMVGLYFYYYIGFRALAPLFFSSSGCLPLLLLLLPFASTPAYLFPSAHLFDFHHRCIVARRLFIHPLRFAATAAFTLH